MSRSVFSASGLVLVAAASVSAVSGRQADLSSVVEGIQQRYAAVESVTAQFRQTYRAPGIDQTEAGVMFMKKPGLMRWEYLEPEEKLFVADGRETYLYSPEERQVMVGRFSSEEFHSTPLQFLLGRGDLAASFQISWEEEESPLVPGTFLLRLVPRAPDSQYSYVVLECDKGTFDLRRLLIKEPTGSTSEFLFAGLETNVEVSDAKFRFKIPKGVEVVRLDRK